MNHRDDYRENEVSDKARLLREYARLIEPMTPLIAQEHSEWLLSAATFIEQETARADAAEAKIDALMLEYCPDEMTDNQRKKWAAAQEPITYEQLVRKVWERKP